MLVGLFRWIHLASGHRCALGLVFTTQHYLERYLTDNALKASASLYCLYTTSISHHVEIISPGWVRASLMLFYKCALQLYLCAIVPSQPELFFFHYSRYVIIVFISLKSDRYCLCFAKDEHMSYIHSL